MNNLKLPNELELSPNSHNSKQNTVFTPLIHRIAAAFMSTSKNTNQNHANEKQQKQLELETNFRTPW